jgi:acyl-CoA reductase-like NAD-dependent aldehyde dehydrogenase
MAKHTAPHFYLWIHGEGRDGNVQPDEIRNPYDGTLVGTVSMAGRRQIRDGIRSSQSACQALKAMSRFRRAELLLRMRDSLRDIRAELVDALILEGGKPRVFAEQEFARTLATFTWAAEEARRFCGEMVPLDGLERGAGYEGHTRREPLGIIFGITPFNFPLNLVAHKVAPALASGNAIIIKPATNTPIAALLMARVASAAGWPDGSLNVLPMRHRDVPLLLTDDRIRMISFTGSPDVGWQLKRSADKQRITLELGGNSGTYVDSDADLAWASERLALGGFAQAGQSCIAVQRIYVQQQVYEPFLEMIVAQAKATQSGNPHESDTVVGPVISAQAADRIMAIIDEAVADGARIACGGKRLTLGIGNVIEPTVLTDVHEDMLVCSKEIFAPVITILPVSGIDEAIRRINNSPFGLQAAVFSRHLPTVQAAIERIETGGIIINDFPTFRVDHMPYGGVKSSGLGREGIRSAMLEMSEPKMIVTRLEPQPKA